VVQLGRQKLISGTRGPYAYGYRYVQRGSPFGDDSVPARASESLKRQTCIIEARTTSVESVGVRTGSLPHCTPSSLRSQVNYLDVSKVLYVRQRAAGAKGGLRAMETFGWNMSFIAADTTT